MTVGKFLRIPIKSVQLPTNTATRLPGFDLAKSEAVVKTILYSSDSAKTTKSKIHNFNRQIYKMACKLTKTLDNVAGYRQITIKRQEAIQRQI